MRFRLPLPRHIACVVLSSALMVGCQRSDDVPPTPHPAPTPEAAVQRLLDDLRHDDLAAYAADALPPELYRQTEDAWREGRSRWPVSELPLGARLPEILDNLSVPGAEVALRAGYRQQLAGAGADVRAAARSLGMFATNYVAHEAGYPPAERAHRLQLVHALATWGATAPLADARKVTPRFRGWIRIARATGLQGGETAWSSAGRTRSLSRLRPVLRETKESLAVLGLDIDDALAHARVEPVSANGDRAQVRLTYRLAGQPVVALVDLERYPEGWYLVDSLRHARTPSGPRAGAAGALRHNAADGPADPPAVPGRLPSG